MRRSLVATASVAAASVGLVGLSIAPVSAAVAVPFNGGLMRPAPGDGPASAVGASSKTSENWSGYALTGKAGSFSESEASWTVPTVLPGHNGYSSTWVGVDGYSDDYLVQTGTEADMVNGKATYDAWWEVITPSDEAPEVVYTGDTIHPGDTITASVAKYSSSSWTMSITDHTTGVTKSHTSTFGGPGESAEWIQEDTDVDGVISPAPDWKKVTFSGITVNENKAKLSSGVKLNIVDTLGTHETQTSAPTSAGNGFSVKWLASGTGTPTG